jgi:chromate transport protein ChrA
MTVTALAGFFTLPTVALILFLVAKQLFRGYDQSLLDALVLGVPAVAGYPVAVALWWGSRRARSARWAWVLAVLGIVVVIAVSAAPLWAVGYQFYDEWKETQPGGRGYHP